MPYRTLTRLVAALAILGCASSLPAIATAQQSRPHAGGGRQTICVASSIGHKYELKTIGLMVFGNDLKTASIKSWGIDGLVVQRLSAGLSSKYAVRAVSISPDALKSTPVGGRSIFESANADAPFKAALSHHAKSGCAYVAIVRPYRGQYTGTNQTIEGLGIVKHGADGLIVNYSTYGVFTPQLYDSRTGDRVRLPAGDIFSSSWLQKANASDWPASPEAATQSAKLREAARRLVTSEIDKDAQRILKALGNPE